MAKIIEFQPFLEDNKEALAKAENIERAKELIKMKIDDLEEDIAAVTGKMSAFLVLDQYNNPDSTFEIPPNFDNDLKKSAALRIVLNEAKHLLEQLETP